MERPIRKVLVVDDHDDSAFVLARLLKQDGHFVQVAISCSEARAKAQADRFDLLICDIGLPDGDGCELLREMLSLYPVERIAVSGYGSSSEIARCKMAGFTSHLLKPIKYGTVRAAINGSVTPTT